MSDEAAIHVGAGLGNDLEVLRGKSRLPFSLHLGRPMLQWWDLLTGKEPADWWIRIRGLNGPLWLLAVAGLAAGIWWYRQPIRVDLPVVEAGSAPAEARRQDRGAPGLPAAGSQLRGKTLFEAQRQPRARAASERNVTLTELSKGLQLQAIIGGDKPRAVIFNSATNQSQQVTAGQFIGEIEVKSIGTTTVELGWKGESIELSM